jgi:O-antigen/teichoic acid export membrane protein
MGAPETAAPELRRRVVVSALLLGVRGLGVRILGLAGNVALARLLVPSEFGTVALALSILAFGTVVFDGGLGASLMRRPREPTVDELRNVLAVQLAGAFVLTTSVAAAGLWIGEEAGTVAAVMMLALPLVALRGPGVVLLERRLTYGPVATVEVGEVIAYYGWAVLAVALGFGVWGLATASIVKALIGTVILLKLVPGALLRPAVSRRQIRELLGLGIRVQSVEVLKAARDQAVNMGTFVIAGAATLGLWALAARLLQIPLLLFEALWRLSFPALSQLMAAGEDPKRLMERGVAVVAATTGLVGSVLVCSTPALIPAVFGARWSDAAGAVALTCLGLQISGPISAVASGYIFASDQAGILVRNALAQAIVWLAVSLPLLPWLGATALGVGYVALGIVEAVVLSRAARRLAGAQLVRPLLLPVAIGVPVSVAGWLAVSALAPTLAAAAGGAVLGATAYAGALFVLQRRLFLDMLRMAGQARRRVARTA